MTLTQILAFPAIILPAFIAGTLLLALLLRRRSDTPWTYRDLLTGLCLLALAASVLHLRSAQPAPPPPAPASEPVLEVDMQVSGGNLVELYLNDWQHPPERLAVVPGQRHLYRFKNLPRDIALLRLDPTEQAKAQIVLYGLAVKSGDRVLRQFAPAELKAWTLVNLASPNDSPTEGLNLVAANDDPILWTRTAISIPEAPKAQLASPPWLSANWHWILLPFSLLILLALRFATGDRVAQLARPLPEFPITSWIALAVLLLVTAGTFYLQHQRATDEIGADLDMQVSRGNMVDLYFNDWEHPPERIVVVPGQRHVYHFASLPQHITLIRLDPTDQADAKVILYGLTVKSSKQTFLDLGPADFRKWNLVNLAAPKDEDGGLSLTDTNDDPIVWGPVSVQLPGGILQSIAVALIENPDGPTLLAITAFLLLLVGRMSTRAGRVQACLVALLCCVAYPIVWLPMQLHLASPPVTAAVGYVSYKGYPKADEFYASMALLIVSVGLGLLFAKFLGSREPEPLEPPVTPSRNWSIWTAAALVFCLAFLYFLPNLSDVLQGLRQVTYQRQGWDDTNGLSWYFLTNAGLRPFKDFWYPYSGAYLQMLPFPAGLLASVTHSAIVLGALFLGLLLATGRKISHALVIFGFILTPVLLEMLPTWPRYLLAVDIALFYVAISGRTRLAWKTHLPFAIFVGYVFFYEPPQVIYAGAGIGLHVLAMALSRLQGRSIKERLTTALPVLQQAVICTGLPILAGIAGALFFYGMNGMLPGFWDFEKNIGVTGDYGALPSEIIKWVQPDLQPDTVFLLLFLLMSYAVYRWVRGKGQEDPLGTALLVLCGVAYMAMQKQVVRPHAMTQVRVFPYVAVLIFGLMAWRERKPAARIIIAAFAGCILGIALEHHMLTGILTQDVEAAPAKISGSLHALLYNLPDFERANVDRFGRARFIGFNEQNAAVDALFQSGLRADDNVYVLGDDPVIYILLNKRPPYITNSYNDSPLYDQEKVLAWFRQANPRFIVWGSKDLIFDAVPHTVRLPLLYTYITEHYQFVKAVGLYHILTLKPPAQPSDLKDLAYWRSALGDQLDLGFIPSRARESEYAPCGADRTRCDAVLTVKFPSSTTVAAGRQSITLDSPAGPMTVLFDLAPGQHDYVINLNRLWFWNLLQQPATPRLAPGTPAQVTVDYRLEPSPVLY